MAAKQQEKDVVPIKVLAFFRNFLWVMPFLGLVGYALAGFPGLLAGIAASIGFAHTTGYRLKKPGGRAVARHWIPDGRSDDLRKHLALDLNQVRFHKMCRRFDAALHQIEDILCKDPEFPEALFLKAQLLWEGYEDREGAQQCLLKIVSIEPDSKAVFHRWAILLYQQLSENQRRS